MSPYERLVNASVGIAKTTGGGEGWIIGDMPHLAFDDGTVGPKRACFAASSHACVTTRDHPLVERSVSAGQFFDFAGRVLHLRGHVLDLGCDHGKALARVARARGFDGRVDRQHFGLCREPPD